MKKKPKSNAQPFGANSITMKEWQKLHPIEFKSYGTDVYYLKIANKIVRILEDKGLVGAYSKDDVRFVALRLAAYFEDVVSELCVFRSFLNYYHFQNKREFPWYQIKEEYLKDEVNLVDVQFVLWYSLLARRDSSVPNPENLGILDGARSVFNLFVDEFEKAPVNEELANDIFNKGILEDAQKLKTILIWLSSSSYLSMMMFPARNELQPTLDKLRRLFYGLDSESSILTNIEKSYIAFTQNCGPAAIAPQGLYSNMCLEKNQFYGTENLSDIKVTPFYPFIITWESHDYFILCSCRGQEYRVLKKSFLEPELRMLGEGVMVETMLFYYNGYWHSFGANRITPFDDVDEGFDELERISEQLVKKDGTKVDLLGKADEDIPGNSQYGPAYDPLKCARAINNNDGNRLFYFKDPASARKWIKENLGGKNIEALKLPDTEGPIAIYIRIDFTVCFTTEVGVIHDPSNPYYEQNSERELFTAMLQPEKLSNTICFYMMCRDYTDRLSLESIHGQEHGRKLMQDNLQFFMTLMRQFRF